MVVNACIFIPWPDPGFIIWNPVRPLMEIEEYEWMQAELEKIWPPIEEA